MINSLINTTRTSLQIFRSLFEDSLLLSSYKSSPPCGICALHFFIAATRLGKTLKVVAIWLEVPVPAQRIRKLLLGHENVKLCQKVMAGEDSAFCQQLIPGIMLSIGTRNEEAGLVDSPHSCYFFLDEDVLPVGAALHAALAESYLDKHQHSVQMRGEERER
ncbi:hypothetical protein ACFX11_019779 [Malus domestica]